MPGRPDMAVIARLRNAVERGKWCNASDRELLRRLDALCAGSAELARRVREFHRRCALRAVAAGAAGVVYAGAGFPAQPMPHLTRGGRVMPGRHVFAYPDPAVTFVNLGALAHERVTAVTAAASEPEALMDMPAVRKAGQPLQLQLQLVAHYWAPEVAEWVIFAYARLLPPGSTLVLTLGTPVTEGGRELAAVIAAAAGLPVHAHTAADVRGWLGRAGLEQPDIRVMRSRSCPCGVIITATAAVP